MKLLAVVGARPQFVKDAAIRRAIDAFNARSGVERIDRVLIHTGQHYDANLSQVFFDELGIEPPACNLDVGSGSHGQQTGDILQRLEPVLMEHRPDCVLLYGDTNSTLAGALAAAKLAIPTVHIEAGLRSFNRHQPEEINRKLTDHVSDMLLCPTYGAVEQLAREGIREGVHWIGDVMYDCALHYGREASEIEGGVLSSLGVAPGQFVLATVHRPENTEVRSRLAAVFEALEQLARPERPVLVPLHPRTRARLADHGLEPGDAGGALRLISPVGYLQMVALERHAALIVTDSGGVQKEAYFHGVPCVTLRDETEWTETVSAGWNQVVGADRDRILEAAGRAQPGEPIGDYGDGEAAIRAIELIAGRFA